MPIAGWAGGSESGSPSDGTESATPTEVPTLNVPEGDAALTFTLDGGAEEFETLVVDHDRIVFRGESEDATITLAVSGLDMTELSQDGKTYFEDEPFPGENYTEADLYLTFQEATFSDGNEATYTGESPVNFDLVLFDDPLEVPSGRTTTFNLGLNASTGFRDEDEFSFSISWGTY